MAEDPPQTVLDEWISSVAGFFYVVVGALAASRLFCTLGCRSLRGLDRKRLFFVLMIAFCAVRAFRISCVGDCDILLLHTAPHAPALLR